MYLVVGIKPFTLLLSIGRQQGCINIKEHEFLHLYGIDLLSELPHDLVKLPECIIIHTVKEPGQCRLSGTMPDHWS